MSHDNKVIRIGFDIDGVLADFVPAAVKIINDKWPGRAPENFRPSDWDFSEVLKKGEWSDVWRVIRKMPSFWRGLSPIENNVSTVRDLLQFSRENVEVYYITSRVPTESGSVLVDTTQWLHNQGLVSLRTSIIPVAHHDNKANIIRGLEIPYFVDDYDVTVDGLQGLEIDTKGRKLKAWLQDREHNRHALHLPRVKNLEEYLMLVNNEEKIWR